MEFSFDNLSHLQKKGFAIEPVKGKVDRGHVKCISVFWVPPADFDVSNSCTLLLKPPALQLCFH